MRPKSDLSHISRRALLAAGSAIGLTAAMPASVLASAVHTLSTGRKRRVCEPDLAKFLCRSVHDRLAEELDRVIADPMIDGEQTALALMEARCPGCGERVHPANSRLSAVIPQWQWQSSGSGTTT